MPLDATKLGAVTVLANETLPFSVVVDVPAVEPIAMLVVEPAAPDAPMLIVLVEPDAVTPLLTFTVCDTVERPSVIVPVVVVLPIVVVTPPPPLKLTLPVAVTAPPIVVVELPTPPPIVIAVVEPVSPAVPTLIVLVEPEAVAPLLMFTVWLTVERPSVIVPVFDVPPNINVAVVPDWLMVVELPVPEFNTVVPLVVKLLPIVTIPENCCVKLPNVASAAPDTAGNLYEYVVPVVKPLKSKLARLVVSVASCKVKLVPLSVNVLVLSNVLF